MVINVRNDCGEIIFYIFVWSNFFVKIVKYFLLDYKEIVNKFIKNGEFKILFDVVWDWKVDFVEKELGEELVE